MLLTGRVISLGSVAGFLAVLGLAARHAIMQVKHVQHAERREGEAFGRDLIIRGARERFGSVLTSVFTTALFFIPLAVVGPNAGLELVQPMAFTSALGRVPKPT